MKGIDYEYREVHLIKDGGQQARPMHTSRERDDILKFGMQVCL